MCGLAGVMMKQGRPLDRAVLDRLQAALAHRGPDGFGRHEQPGLGLVHTRLAIVDLVTGDQPLCNAAGVAVIVNGEMYNAPELRAARPGWPFRTQSDCEVVLPLFEEADADFARGLRGMYAVALYDPATRRLLLARDPFGIKPLYTAETPAYFAFASEAEALLQAGLVPVAIDPAKRDELLQLKYTTGPATIFPGVQRVLPGETLTLRDGEIIARQQVPALPPGTGRAPAARALATALAGFERVMTESVAVHLRMDTPWRLYFSGGIDSAVLLTLASRVSPTPVEALTIGYEGAEAVDESRRALRIAAASGVACERVEMTAADFWTLAPRIAAAIDDPCADPAVLPTYRLAVHTRAVGAKVALSGEGADELFAGYARYRRALLPAFLRRRASRRGVFSRTAGAPGFTGWDAGIIAVERREAAARHNRLATLLAIDTAEWLPNNLLIKLDRCLMAVGIEGRTPFLDAAVIGFADSLPDRLRVRFRHGKVLLREWLAVANPAAEPFARKQGFGVPIGRWMAPRAEELGRLVAAQPGIAAVFRPEVVGRVFAECAAQPQPAWSLLFYALWHSHHLLGLDPLGDVTEVLNAAAARSAAGAPARVHAAA